MPNVDDVEGTLLDHDVVWVMGGSVANLLALWRVHGLDRALRRAWQAGVVLSGVSAGSICWFEGGATDSYGPDLRPVVDALGFLPYGNGVHYDSDPGRRPLIHRMVADGTLPTAHPRSTGTGVRAVTCGFGRRHREHRPHARRFAGSAPTHRRVPSENMGDTPPCGGRAVSATFFL